MQWFLTPEGMYVNVCMWCVCACQGMDYVQCAAAYDQGQSVDNESESVNHSHVDD